MKTVRIATLKQNAKSIDSASNSYVFIEGYVIIQNDSNHKEINGRIIIHSMTSTPMIATVDESDVESSFECIVNGIMILPPNLIDICKKHGISINEYSISLIKKGYSYQTKDKIIRESLSKNKYVHIIKTEYDD